MGILSDKEILELCKTKEMLSPFVERSIKEKLDKSGMYTRKLISYGVSSYGYDLRAADEFKIFTGNLKSELLIDPKNYHENNYHKVESEGYCIIPPNSFALTRSIEYIKMPTNITGICMGKSTYARCGLIANVTPLEAGWEGYLTIELSNTTPLPVKVYANEGIVQILFFQGATQCATSYADRNGKYQGQTGITGSKL